MLTLIIPAYCTYVEVLRAPLDPIGIGLISGIHTASQFRSQVATTSPKRLNETAGASCTRLQLRSGSAPAVPTVRTCPLQQAVKQEFVGSVGLCPVLTPETDQHHISIALPNAKHGRPTSNLIRSDQFSAL